ncbi:unnamed protein product [Vitrella brassicaformis CCMP3155]|uniref:Potassium channel tetramerisation-type BTB domain-containing protein n=1 Tax=Vitrella brassicaformis (strain CCMP3155) TaxID=1169540 RepID=A0A0G4FQV9_VITBC|nr:unnamed protein product [Vitrella brassicaformis CCMP3155]|eukprot:CEM16837.1 unnamed protein product [Vitrella brassicaformis CCMP3155]
MDADLAARKFSAIAILDRLHVPVTAIGDAIGQLHAQIRQADDAAHRERQKHGASDPSSASPDDELTLSVGGVECHVSRKHMTEGDSVEGTLLAALFSGCWDGRLRKDDKQRIFVDVCPEAFKAIHKAILDAVTLRSAGRAASVGHLLHEATKRDYRGLHDFWVKLLLSPLDKAASDAPPTADGEPNISAESLPAHSGSLVSAVEAIVRAANTETARLEGQLEAAKRRYTNLDNEIKAVTPFLAPLSGEDPIRSVRVCGHAIATTQSTVDEMNDKLNNRFDMWPRPVEVVQPDHIGRMVDHYRRKRLGASAADMAVVLTMASETEQVAFNINAAMYGVETDIVISDTSGDGLTQRMFVRLPSGVFHQVVQHGSGPKPTRGQRVKYDFIQWRDDFDGQDKIGEDRGRVLCVSGFAEWWQEVVTDMRVGEVRRVIKPGRLSSTGKDLYIEYRLLAIL